mmetsp:Transcript_38380/g.113967  ORF Transcript_38380/g.113967 Transcript_38380/m.113967 type:complete len:245 (+) Transcript_38380:144-878(+)
MHGLDLLHPHLHLVPLRMHGHAPREAGRPELRVLVRPLLHPSRWPRYPSHLGGNGGHCDLGRLPGAHGDSHPCQDRRGRRPEEREPAEVPDERPGGLLPLAHRVLRPVLVWPPQPALHLVQHGRAPHRRRHHGHSDGHLAVHRLRHLLVEARGRPGVRGGLGRLQVQRVHQRLVARGRAQPAPLPQLPGGALRPEALLERQAGPHPVGHRQPVVHRRDVLRLPRLGGRQGRRAGVQRERRLEQG